MANALPDLVINIAANTATLTDGITKATAQISGFGKSATSSLGAIEGAATLATRGLGALGVVLSAGSIVSYTKGVIDAAEKLATLAEVTGSSVTSLSRLTNLATVSGTSFDTLQTAMSKISVGIENAGDASNNTARALAYLGVTSKDPAQALQEVASRLDDFRDGAGKVALAVDLFGRGGASLLPILHDMATQTSVVATVTAEQAEAAKALNEQIAIAKVNFTDTANAILNNVVPPLVTMVSEFNAAKAAGLSTWDALGETVIPSDLGKRIAETSAEIAKLQKSLASVGTTKLGAAGTPLGDLNSAKITAKIDELTASLDRLRTAQDNWALSWARSLGDTSDARDLLVQRLNQKPDPKPPKAPDTSAFDAYTHELDQLTKQAAQADAALDALFSTDKVSQAYTQFLAYVGSSAWNKLTLNQKVELESIAHNIDATTKLTDNMKAWAQESGVVADQIKTERDAWEAQGKAILTSADAYSKSLDEQAKYYSLDSDLARYLTTLDTLQATLAASQISADDYAAAVDRLNTAFANLSSAKAAGKAASELQATMAQTAQNIGDSFANALSDGIFNSGRQAGEDLRRSLESMFDNLVLRPLLAPIGTGLAGALIGGGGGLGSPGSLSALQSLFTGGLASAGLYGSLAASGIGQSLGLSTEFTGPPTAAGLGSIGLTGLGTAIGSAIPYIGVALAAASALGLFNKSPSQVSGQFGVTSGTGGFEDNAFTKSPFGNLGFLDSGTQQFSGQAAQAFNQVVSGALAAFATRLTTSQQGDLASHLQGTSFAGASGTFTTEDFLQKYGATVLKQVIGEAFDELNPAMAALARNFQGTADEVTSFSNGLLALYDITNKLPTSIQSGLVAALDETQDTLTRITALAGAYKAVQDALNADPIADAQAAVEASTNSLSLAFTQQGTALDALVAKFDGSATAATDLANATSAYYNAEVQLLAGLKQASASISDSFAETARGIKLSTLDQKGQGDFLADEMNSLFASLLKATDPAQIQSLADRINQDVNQSFSLLSPDEQKQRAQEYLDYVDKANAAAQAHIDEVQQQVQQQAATENDKLRDIVTDVINKLNDAGGGIQAGAATFLQAVKTPITVVVDDVRKPEVNGGVS